MTLFANAITAYKESDYTKALEMFEEAGRRYGANMVRVSVIIPTYARPRNLLAALESVASQEYPDIQLIVVSDNPPETAFAEETRAIVEGFKKESARLRVEFIQHRQNRNGAAARNTGWFHSNGEFVCFLDDDDDVYLPGRISMGVDCLCGEPENVGAVYCGFVGWNPPADDPQRYKGGDLTSELLLLDYEKHYLCTNTATYRRSALERINGFDETYQRHQDLELNLLFFEFYQIGVVRHTGVRLCPEPTGVDNKLFNSNFLRLKQKFLDRFRKAILALGAENAKVVYERHWSEVVRYVKDTREVYLLSGSEKRQRVFTSCPLAQSVGEVIGSYFSPSGV